MGNDVRRSNDKGYRRCDKAVPDPGVYYGAPPVEDSNAMIVSNVILNVKSPARRVSSLPKLMETNVFGEVLSATAEGEAGSPCTRFYFRQRRVVKGGWGVPPRLIASIQMT